MFKPGHRIKFKKELMDFDFAEIGITGSNVPDKSKIYTIDRPYSYGWFYLKEIKSYIFRIEMVESVGIRFEREYVSERLP